MKDETPSRTAAWVAAARGLGMLLPDETRLAEDPYGVEFAAPMLAKLVARNKPKTIAQLPAMRAWILYMQVRTRILDDAVRSFIGDGGRQLVLLGAGYDCRALRLDEIERTSTSVFEVDHPATQGHKKATLERIGATSPAKYIAWHFEKQTMSELGAALAAAGHDPSKPTLTIWEGVTMYLTEGAIDTSLRAIRGWSAISDGTPVCPTGSKLAMTYFARSRLATPSIATRAVQAIVTRVGEPWKFGWDPALLGEYVAKRGFTLDKDIAMGAAARDLLPPSDAVLVGHDDRRVAIVGASAEAIAIASAT